MDACSFKNTSIEVKTKQAWCLYFGCGKLHTCQYFKQCEWRREVDRKPSHKKAYYSSKRLSVASEVSVRVVQSCFLCTNTLLTCFFNCSNSGVRIRLCSVCCLFQGCQNWKLLCCRFFLKIQNIIRGHKFLELNDFMCKGSFCTACSEYEK